MLQRSRKKKTKEMSAEEAACLELSSVALYLTRLSFCPPLPLVTTGGRVCSSHDLLASIFINVPENRHKGEAEVHKRFMDALTSSTDFFELCCRSTVELLGFATTTSNRISTQFKRPEDVCMGDAVQTAMAHFCTAQSILLDKTPTLFVTYKQKSYADLLEVHKQRFALTFIEYFVTTTCMVQPHSRRKSLK